MQKIGFVWQNDSKTRRPQTIRVFPQCGRCHTPREKGTTEKTLRGAEKINTVSNYFDFCENDYNLAENTEFCARSNLNSFANFGPLMTNDGVLESSRQEEISVGCLAGVGDN